MPNIVLVSTTIRDHHITQTSSVSPSDSHTQTYHTQLGNDIMTNNPIINKTDNYFDLTAAALCSE